LYNATTERPRDRGARASLPVASLDGAPGCQAKGPSLTSEGIVTSALFTCQLRQPPVGPHEQNQQFACQAIGQKLPKNWLYWAYVTMPRTALINQLRAILLERGLVAPQGKWKLKQFLNVLMDEQGGASLSPRMIMLVEDARAQWAELDRRIAAFDAEFVRWAKENEEARRLTTIPGIGAIVASALVAAVGRAESFNDGRDLAAWLGLVPRQFTTGGKPKLVGISKRGNKYLRKQLIHGARAALPHIAERDTLLGRWAKELMSRTHRNVAVVALANELARIAWAVLQRRKLFDSKAVSVAA
jgi:transposase